MADLQITGLDALAEAGIQPDDVLAVADLSATQTKKVKVKDLVNAVVTNTGTSFLAAGAIPGSKIGTLGANAVVTASITNLSVTAAKIADDTITATQIAANAIGSSELADNAVDAGALAVNSVTTTKITDLSVVTDKLASNAVTTVKIADSSVTSAKLNLSDGVISGAKLTSASVTSTQLATNSVTATELADNAVDTNAILNAAVTGGKIAATTITGSNLVNKTITATQIADNTVTATQVAADAIGASELADDAVDTAAIVNGAVTNTKIADGTIAYAKLNLADGSIPSAKIAAGAIGSSQIAANAIGANELADDAVDTAAIADGAVVAANIATDTITANQIAANAIGASELADNAVDAGAITADAVTTVKILDANVTAAKLAANLPGSILATGAIGSTQLAANSVTDSELANNAVDTGAIQNGAVTNDKVETSTSATTGLDGATKIRDATITPAKLNTSNLDRSINVASGNLGINNAVTAATRSGITYNAQGLITGTVALAASDLPLATTSAVGGISVGTGLAVTGAGALSLSNSVTGATVSGITFNAQGMITAATALTAANLPVATTSAKGAVQITSGGGLSVDGSGNLTTSTSGISAGTYQSITVNNKGVATAGAALTAALIPNLAASKITSGSFDAARIANDSIDGSKLSNTSTAIFQSIAQSGYPTADYSGQILFDTVSEDAFIWDGNAWQAITTLTKGSLVFGGTYNAGTSQMVATTSAGIAAGLAVGSNLPTPSATTDGVYVVVSSSGTPSSPAPAIAFAPPDYILGVTNSAGSSWNEVDLSQTVAGQVASNITFTPYGQLSATNVQDALQELETEKLAKSGGTVTGELLIGNTGSFVFEGATVDAFETRLTVADPTTSDKTITLPNVTGTVITTGDTNTVNKDMVDGSLINTNIAANAAIAFTKLAALTSAQILVGNGSNEPTAVAVTGDIGINNAGLTSITAGAIVNADISGSAQITGSKVTTGTTSAVGVLQLTNSTSSTSATTAATPAAVKTAFDLATTANTNAANAAQTTGATFTGNLLVDNDKEVRFFEADSNGSTYVGIKGATDKGSEGSYTISLPAASPTAGQILKANASTPTTLEWGSDSATDSTKMPLAGGTFTGDVTFTGDSSNGLWDKSASAFVANLTGNAATATALATARTIGGTSFDGTADIAVALAATATALATARTIGGVSFDGTANITLPGVNASGTQDTSGTAALATSFTVTANNSTDETVYPLFADGATGSQGAETDTGLTYNPSTGRLTSTSFGGAFIGNADTATKANSVQVDATTDTNCFPMLTAAGATGQKAVKSSSNLSFNSSTGALTSTTFVGAFTGDVTGNASGSAATVTGAAQSAITSVGTLTGLTVSGDLTLDSATNAGKDIVWDESASTLKLSNASASSESVKLIFGNASTQKLTLYQTAGNSGIVAQTGGDLHLQTMTAGDVRAESVGDIYLHDVRGQSYLKCIRGTGTGDNAVEIYHGNTTKKLETTSTGVTVTGTLVSAGLTVDTNTLHVDATNNRVGINTTSPDNELEIQGATDPKIKIESQESGNKRLELWIDGGTAVGYIAANQSASSLQFQTTNTTALTLDSSQNATFAAGVGCGAAPGGYKLQVTEGTGNEIARFSGANGANLVFRNATSNEMLLYVPSADSLKFATNGYANVALTLDSSQNATFAGTVTATSFSGSGANLTNLPAGGGSITATASGAIAANKSCVVNANGTVSQIASSTVPSVLTSRDTESGSDAFLVRDSVWVTSTFFVVVGVLSSNSSVRSYKGTVASDGAITLGAVGYITGNTGGNGLVIAADESTSKILTIQSHSNDFYMKGGAINSNGDGLDMGAADYGSSGSTYTNQFSKAITSNDNGEFMGVYRCSNNVRFRAFTLNASNSISKSAEADLGGTYSPTNSAGSLTIEYIPSVEMYLVITENASNLRAVWVKSNGTGSAPTLSEYSTALTGAALGTKPQISYDAVSGKGVLSYRNTLGKPAARVLSFSGSAVSPAVPTLGSEVLLKDESCDFIRHVWNKTKEMAVFYICGDDNHVKCYTISGTSLVDANYNLDIFAGVDYAELTICTNPSLNRVIVATKNEGSSNYLSVSTLDIPQTETNLTAENFVGFSSAGYSDTATATINVVGNTTTQSSLTPGQKYYVKIDGTLSTTADSPSVDAGLALTSTSLLIK